MSQSTALQNTKKPKNTKNNNIIQKIKRHELQLGGVRPIVGKRIRRAIRGRTQSDQPLSKSFNAIKSIIKTKMKHRELFKFDI
mgnify:CR=1 FL=1